MSCGAKSCLSSAVFYASPDRRVEHVSTWLGRMFAAARQALQRKRQRNRLLELDDRLLQDIGVTRDQAREEGRKPLWH
ncbi:MAG: DUF1127 domain-containing protein [Xanthobacteraceae bacterium]|jgi:uncharacterized protein YjiS (DUF1127 family)